MLAPQYTHKKWLRIKFAKPTTSIMYNPENSIVEFSKKSENWKFFFAIQRIYKEMNSCQVDILIFEKYISDMVIAVFCLHSQKPDNEDDHTKPGG